jgi:hypothetical protein
MSAPDIRYVTWDGNLIPAETSIKRYLGDLFNELELPAASMASDVSSIANTAGTMSGTAYRLMLTPLLAKVGRLERAMVPQATKAIKLAMRYQGLPIEDVMVKTQSAMPVIPLEESQRIAALAASGIFMGEAGTQYLLEQAGVDPEMAATIAKESGNQQIGAF